MQGPRGPGILRDAGLRRPGAIHAHSGLKLRTNTVGVAGKIAQCVGARLPNTVRQIDDEKEITDQSL